MPVSNRGRAVGPGRAAIALMLSALPDAALAVGDARRGETLYEARCGGCHSIATDRVGPRHAGLIGRKAGSVPGFSYSPALRQASFSWTAERLDQWLQGPPKMVPGTRMFVSVRAARDRADIIAYLASASSQPRAASD